MRKQTFRQNFPERHQWESGNFAFPLFWAAAVAKPAPELGYDDLACYSPELQCSSLGDPAVQAAHNRLEAHFCRETFPKLLYGN